MTVTVVVVGVLAFASALVRQPVEALPDWQARGGELQTFLLPSLVDDAVGENPTFSVARQGRSAERSAEASEALGDSAAPAGADPADVASDSSWAPGRWQIACEIKNGSALVFDRASLRDYGPVTLFRWSAPPTRVAGPGERIFTAVVNCREKTIEAAWPGRSRATYAGTCGRGLVEAVCTAAEQASATGHPRTPGSSRAVRHGTDGPK